MNDVAANFVGSIPEHYDRELGPRLFFGYANGLAARVSALNPKSVLELAAGTGILSRKLRDALPDSCKVLATDLNAPMLETAKNKFDAEENIDFEQANAANFARGLVFGNPLLEEIRTRGGDPEIVCSAVEVAISRKLGSSMPLQAVIIEAS